MKARKVIVLIELLTNETVNDIKDNIRYHMNYSDSCTASKVVQIQTNVVQKRTISKGRGKR